MPLHAEEIVRTFCEAWEMRDLERVMALLAPDVVYQNVPQPIMHGRRAARQLIAPIIRETTRIEFILHSIVASPDGVTVLTERLDRLHYDNGVVEIALMGIFVVRSGRITEWRDYADSASVARQFGAAGVTLALDPPLPDDD